MISTADADGVVAKEAAKHHPAVAAAAVGSTAVFVVLAIAAVFFAAFNFSCLSATSSD